MSRLISVRLSYLPSADLPVRHPPFAALLFAFSSLQPFVMAQRPDWREFVALVSRPCALALDTQVHLEPYHTPDNETVRHSEPPPLPLHLHAHLSGQWERQHLYAGAPNPASAFLPKRLDELANALRAYRDGVLACFAPPHSSPQDVRLRETPPVLWDKMRAFRFKKEPRRPLDEVCRIASSLRSAVEQVCTDLRRLPHFARVEWKIEVGDKCRKVAKRAVRVSTALALTTLLTLF